MALKRDAVLDELELGPAPVEFSSIVPVLSMMPESGRIAPSLITMWPAFSVTGV